MLLDKAKITYFKVVLTCTGLLKIYLDYYDTLFI